MPCLACGGVGAPVCGVCLRSLRTPPERAVGHGVVVGGVWVHRGAARRLVHRLKYDAMPAVARLAAAMAPPPPPGVSVLVPVPRVMARRVLHGIDPATVFAVALGEAWGVPVAPGLVAPTWAPRRAGSDRRRAPPAFRLVMPVPMGAVVVDDVVTSGATVGAVAQLLGSRRAFALTVVAPAVVVANPSVTTIAGIRCPQSC